MALALEDRTSQLLKVPQGLRQSTLGSSFELSRNVVAIVGP